jgi:hypothetical protein
MHRHLVGVAAVELGEHTEHHRQLDLVEIVLLDDRAGPQLVIGLDRPGVVGPLGAVAVHGDERHRPVLTVHNHQGRAPGVELEARVVVIPALAVLNELAQLKHLTADLARA